MKSPIAIPTSTVARNALVTIAVVAGGAALYWLRDILTPLAMAIFLLIMIDGVKRFIEERTRLPKHWAGTAALTLVVLAFLASIAFIVNGAAGFFTDASGVSSGIGPRIDAIIADGARLVGMTTVPTAQELIAGVDIRGYLTSLAATRTYEELIAGILPCFWVYWEVGCAIRPQAVSPNPYAPWIDTYAAPEFGEATDRVRALVDAAAEAASPAVRDAMAEAFRVATRYEWMFWDSAYRREAWPI